MSNDSNVQRAAAAAAAQLVLIDYPSAGDAVPWEFCARGTYDNSVAIVTVELLDESGGGYARRASMADGNWKCSIQLTSYDPGVEYEVRAYGSGGDGSSSPNLTYDSSKPDSPCR